MKTKDIYIAIAVRQYAEGRICLTTDRIGRYLSNSGGRTALWRKLYEWTAQRQPYESIGVGVVNNANVTYKEKLEELLPISITELTLNDVTNKNLPYDMLYFIGLPTTSTTDLENTIERYVKNGGGIYIETPDKEGEIEILRSIESISCQSINRTLFSNAYWTVNGQNHYAYVPSSSVAFLTTINMSNVSSEWETLMTNVEYKDTLDTNITIKTDYRDGSEFGVSYTVAMQNGIVEIEENISTSSSSSFDSSSSSSSTFDDEYWNFCDNIVAYWKMDENQESPIVWDQSRNFQHMGVFESNSVSIHTSSKHVIGIVNGALDFNGVNDQITTAYNQSLNFPNVSFSVSFWIKPYDLDGLIMSKDSVWEIGFSDSKIYITMHSDYGDKRYIMSSTSLPINRWSNITLSYDNAIKKMYAYYNGGLRINSSSSSSSSIDDPFTTMVDYYSPFYFSSNVASSGVNGALDNIYILNKKISDMEAEILWNIGRGQDLCEGEYRYTSSSSSSSSSIDSSSSSSSSSLSSSSSSSVDSSSSSSSSSSSTSLSSESMGNISSSSGSIGI